MFIEIACNIYFLKYNFIDMRSITKISPFINILAYLHNIKILARRTNKLTKKMFCTHFPSTSRTVFQYSKIFTNNIYYA